MSKDVPELRNCQVIVEDCVILQTPTGQLAISRRTARWLACILSSRGEVREALAFILEQAGDMIDATGDPIKAARDAFIATAKERP